VSEGVERFRAAAAASELRPEIRIFDATATAAEAAAAVGCDVAQIVKSLVFVADGAPILVLVSGAQTADRRRLATVLGVAKVRPADRETAEAASGYRVGGVAPLGSGLPTFVDRTLLGFDEVWAAAGEPGAVFAVAPARLAMAAEATVIDVREV
jgi:Cys-tRNA(Pro) deacylase